MDRFVSPDVHGPAVVAIRSHASGKAWLLPVPDGAVLGQLNIDAADQLGVAHTQRDENALVAKHGAQPLPPAVPPQPPVVLP